MKILYELSWLWETLGIALVAAAVCMACAALICKAAKKKLGKKVLAVIGAAVFVGRCADYILRDRERVLSIFVNADMDDRIARIMKKNNLSADEAAEQLRKTDKARADYYNYYTFKKWGDPSSYDVLLNSSRLGGVDATAAKIVEMCKDYFL